MARARLLLIIVALSVGGYAFGTVLGKLVNWATNRVCVERAPFKVGADELVSVEGTYCAKWESN